MKKEEKKNGYDTTLSSTFNSPLLLLAELGQISKTRQKRDFKKIVKLKDHTCACNDLTNFECEAKATGNGKTREITLVELIFWRVFSHLEPLWRWVVVMKTSSYLKKK